MARIPLPTDDELDDRALALLGALPKLNVARMLARTGIAPEFYAALGKLFHEDFLAPDDREVILFRVCRNNGSTYEIAQHRAFSGFSDEIVDGILEDRLDVCDLWHRSLAGCGNRAVVGLVLAIGNVACSFDRRGVAAGAAILPGDGGLGAESGHGHAAARSLGSRTRLQAAAVRVNIQPTRAMPRCRVLRKLPTVLIQPKLSSIRLRRR